MILNAVMCVWNEEDIIESTVKHAFAQGCSNVFIVDNASTDKTVDIAINAGASRATTFKTQYFDEDKKVAHLNATVEYVNNITHDEHIWWLYLDADEFPNFDCKFSIIDVLKNIDSSIMAIRGAMYDHKPTHYPYHVSGYHPIDFMPFCTKSSVGKVPLLRYDKGKPHLWSMGGAHTFITQGVSVPVADDFIQIHHFPYRNPEFTFSRLKKLVNRNDDGTSRIDWHDNFLIDVHKSNKSKPIPSQYQTKYKGLHAQYNSNKYNCLKQNSLIYNFSNIARWYDTFTEKNFYASDFEKYIHLAVYYYFLRQYDIALCRFKDAYNICDDNNIKLWLMVKIAECFAESDIDISNNIITDVIKHNNNKINTYIYKNLDYIINKSKKIPQNTRKDAMVIDVHLHNKEFPPDIANMYNELKKS